MDNASNKSLYTLIAVVIFGIFLSLSYWLFQDQMNNVLADVMYKTSQSTSHQQVAAEYYNKNLVIGGDKVVEGPLVGYSWPGKGSGKEYLPYMDIDPIFDTFGVGIYTISFDMKTTIPGRVIVYTDNQSYFKYYLHTAVQGTTEWKRYSVTVEVKVSSLSAPNSTLSFYGIYGTGVSPSVKNVKIQMGTADGIPVYEESPSSLSY